MKGQFSITLTGQLAEQYGAGELTFKPPLMNESIKASIAAKEAPADQEKKVEALERLSEVKGLIWKDGAPITIEQFKARQLPPDLYFAVVWGYTAYIQLATSKEFAEKNFELHF